MPLSSPLSLVGRYQPSRKSFTLWKVVVTSLRLTCLGDFINSPWKKRVRTIQRSVHHSAHLNGCACQWASPAFQTLFRVSGTRRPILEIYKFYLHHFLLHNRRTPRAPTRKFSKTQRRQSQNQSNHVWNFPAESTLLGHVVNREGIQADPVKTSTVNGYPVLKNATDVKRFSGLCSYYRRDVQDFAKIARPLHQLTEKSKDCFWNSKTQEAFEVLKARLTFASIVVFPSMKEPFILSTDASQHARGAVLAQIQKGSKCVICYASKFSSKAQSR